MKIIEQTQNPVVSAATLVRSETGIKSVSTTKLPVYQHITFVEESAPAKVNNIEQTQRNRPDKNVKTVNATKPMQHPRASVNPAPANIYQVILVPSSSEVPVTQNLARISANRSNGVPIDSRSKITLTTVQPNKVITNQSARNQTVTRPTPPSETLPRNAIPTSQAQSSKTYHTPSSSPAMSHNGLNSKTTTTTAISLGCTHPSGPTTTRVTALQSIQDDTQRHRLQIESNYPAVQRPYKTSTFVGNCQSNVNQLTKPMPGTSFSLETLLKDGVLTSGKNVLTATAEVIINFQRSF